MGKGRAALTYLPQTEIQINQSVPHSVEAIRMVVNKIASLQEDGVQGNAFEGLKCNGNNPYDSSLWTVSITPNTSPEYAIQFESETKSEALTIGRAALSTRRPIRMALETNTNLFSVRSLLAVINFIEKLEDRVAEKNDGAEGDATYTDISLRGFTPYENFVWTITKAGDIYSLTPTVNS